MAIEPTSIQRDRMLAQGKKKIILAQFLNMKDPRATGDYFSETLRLIHEEKGTRDYQLKIEQAITSGDYRSHGFCPTAPGAR